MKLYTPARSAPRVIIPVLMAVLALAGNALSDPMTKKEFMGNCIASHADNTVNCERFLNVARININSRKSCPEA